MTHVSGSEDIGGVSVLDLLAHEAGVPEFGDDADSDLFLELGSDLGHRLAQASGCEQMKFRRGRRKACHP
jgi:CubicO group peptidase (beta-lactamase class C family)